MKRSKRKQLMRQQSRQVSGNGQQVYSAPTNPTPAELYNLTKGKRVISFIGEGNDCCIEKMVTEYAPLFVDEGFALLTIPVHLYKENIKYTPQVVVYFRLGCTDAMQPLMVRQLLEYAVYLKELGIRLIYYLDDLIIYQNKRAPLALAGACDDIIVANESIKQALLKEGFSKPITIVPTHIDLRTIDSLNRVDFGDKKFRILLASSGRIGAIGLYEIIKKANDDPAFANVEFIIVAGGVAQMRTLVNRFRNVKKTYYEFMERIPFYTLCKNVDLIIHPAMTCDLDYLIPSELQQPWLDCKCEVKYTLAGAAGIPIVSSPSASYSKAIEHGKTGLIANSPNEFITYIKMLMENKEYAKEIGDAARKDIEERYDIKKRYSRFRDAILGVVDPNPQDTYTQTSAIKKLWQPMGDGGPRTFFQLMKKHLSLCGRGAWEMTLNPTLADVILQVAFLAGLDVLDILKKYPKIKMVMRMDGLPLQQEAAEINTEHLELMQKLYDTAKDIIWQSQFCRTVWEPYVDTERGRIIHNGVDFGQFNPIGHKYPLDSKKFNIIHVNWSTHQHKRIDFLEKIISEMQGYDPNVYFTLIGNYVPYGYAVVDSMEKWSKYTNAYYMGPINNQTDAGRIELASVFRAADLLLFTSEMEGAPNVLLEAMACGTPLAYNKNSKVVEEFYGDLGFPFEYTEELCGYISAVAGENIPIKEGIIERSKQFNIEKCIKQYIEVFNEQT